MSAGDRVAHDRALYLSALACFNQGAYFECHDRLEDLWLRNRSPLRPFFQGLIQLAAAFHHVDQGRYTGAVGLFKAAGERLGPFAPVTLGLDVAPLLLAIAGCRRHAESLGPDGFSRFDRALIPRLAYQAPPLEVFAPHAGTEMRALPGHTWYWEREHGGIGRSGHGVAEAPGEGDA